MPWPSTVPPGSRQNLPGDLTFPEIVEFGFGDLGLSMDDFLEADQVIQLGRAPNRIDLLTGLSGVGWDEAWRSRIEVDFDGFRIPVIGKDVLAANKEATGRPQDLADLARLRKQA